MFLQIKNSYLLLLHSRFPLSLSSCLLLFYFLFFLLVPLPLSLSILLSMLYSTLLLCKRHLSPYPLHRYPQFTQVRPTVPYYTYATPGLIAWSLRQLTRRLEAGSSNFWKFSVRWVCESRFWGSMVWARYISVEYVKGIDEILEHTYYD